MAISFEPRPWSSFVAMGDSFTEGLMDDLNGQGRHRGWADRVAEVLATRVPEFTYANLAIRGRLTAQVATEQVPIAVSMGADLVSYAAGVNDVLRRSYNPHEAATSVEKSVRELRDGGSDVLLFAFGDPSRRSTIMGSVRSRLRIYNSAINAIARRYDCYLVNFWDVAAFDQDEFWDVDRLHLSPAGHQLAASCALQALGLSDAHWRTPAPIEPKPLWARGVAHGAWLQGHLTPWLMRRVRGTSSGDGITPKRPELSSFP